MRIWGCIEQVQIPPPLPVSRCERGQKTTTAINTAAMAIGTAQRRAESSGNRMNKPLRHSTTHHSPLTTHHSPLTTNRPFQLRQPLVISNDGLLLFLPQFDKLPLCRCQLQKRRLRILVVGLG